MEIKTKFNVEDRLFFLTTDHHILNRSDGDYNKPYVCEGIVDSVRFELRHGNQEIVYGIKVREGGHDGFKWISVNEKWCAPDIVQLGLDVSSRFKVHHITEPKQKKRKK